MEVYEKIQNNINVLSEIKIEDMFPSCIYYPDQEKYQNIPNSSLLTSKDHLEQNNLNLNKNTPTTSKEEIDTNMSNIDSLNEKCNFSSNKKLKGFKNLKKIYYDKLGEIWDLILDEDILAFCGKKFITVFFFRKFEGIQKIEKMNSYFGSNSANFLDCFIEEISFEDENEEYFCLAQSNIFESENLKILAVGGSNCIIKILDLTNKKEFGRLIGHRNDIYDLKFSPQNKNILLSASKDFSIRIWNVKNSLQIAILGGPKGHSADVLSIDWHLSGDYIVSSGIDNCIKIWKIFDDIKENIEKSFNFNGKNKKINNEEINSIGEEGNKKKEKFSTIITTKLIFSTKTVHENYVDCVRYNGNFIISKSMDGIIKEWLPVFNKESDYYYLINTYSYDTKEIIWYVKLSVDPDCKFIATGNTQGKLFIFNINEDGDEEIDSNFDYFYKNDYDYEINTGIKKLIRSVAVYKDLVAFANTDGTVFLTKLGK
jgi:WD40 repeat protein